MICSATDVPERGIPTTKTGFAEDDPADPILEIALPGINPDLIIDEAASGAFRS